MSTPPIPPQPGYEQVILPPTPQAATGYPPAPSQVYPQPGYQAGYQPGYPPPAATRSSNTVLKVVLIILAVFVLLGVVGAGIIGFVGYKVSKAVHRASTGDVSFSTPGGGSISTGSATNISSTDLGLPDYPGAKRASGSMKMKTSSGSLVTAAFTTSDSPTQVVGFYKSKMGEQASVMEGNSSTILSSGNGNEDKLVVTITPGGTGTRITIMRTSHHRGE